MNPRNVEALKAIIDQQLGHALTGPAWDLPLSVEILAEKLAERGVLVPSVLTDEEIIDTLRDSTSFYVRRTAETEFDPESIRLALARIAKGESAP